MLRGACPAAHVVYGNEENACPSPTAHWARAMERVSPGATGLLLPNTGGGASMPAGFKSAHKSPAPKSGGKRQGAGGGGIGGGARSGSGKKGQVRSILGPIIEAQQGTMDEQAAAIAATCGVQIAVPGVSVPQDQRNTAEAGHVSPLRMRTLRHYR